MLDDNAIAIAKIEEGISHIRTTVDEIKDKMDNQDGDIQRLKTGNEIQKEVNRELRKEVAEMRGAMNAGLTDINARIDRIIPFEAREGQYAKSVLKWAAVIIGTTIFNQIPRIIEVLK